MSWDAAFTEALGGRAVGAVFLVERVALYHEPGEPWAAASHPGYGLEASIVAQSLQVSGSTVTPVDWSSTIGEWSFSVQTEDPGALFRALRRGAAVQAWVAVSDGGATTAPQPVALGLVADITGTRGSWLVRCLDVGAILRSRLDARTGGLRLFADVGASTALSSAYTPGDAHLDVVTTAQFEKQTGGAGVVRVTPHTGDPFLLTWTSLGTSPTRVMGLSASGVAGTTAVGASTSGSTVECLVWLDGHPIDIARRVLTSTGVGTNGPWDIYPASWGLGLPYRYLDDVDAQAYRVGVVKASASVAYVWEYAQDEAVDDAWSWLTGWLGVGAMFPAMRQGRLTFRGWQRAPLRSIGYAAEIDDRDIFEVEAWSAYDSDHPTEHQRVTVTGSGGSSSTTLTHADTLPAYRTLAIDISDRASTSAGNLADDVADRYEVPATVIPERVEVRASMRLATLAPGDRVRLTTGQCASRAHGAAGFVDDEAHVAQVATAWDAGYTRLVLLIYSE